MARKPVLNYVFCDFLALALTILFVITGAEGKGGGQNSKPTSSRKSPSSSPTPSSSGSKGPKTKGVKDKNSKVTRCYNEQMVEITCPASKSGKIAGYVVGGIFAVILLFLLYKKIKGRYLSRTNDRGAKDIDLEREDRKIQQTFGDENGGADTPDAPPPQYVEKLAEESEEPAAPLVQGHSEDSSPSNSTITPPAISMPVPEPARPDLSPRPRTMADMTNDALPMPATMPSRKNTLADKLKVLLQNGKQTTAT